MDPPRFDRVGLVEPHRLRDRLPEPVDVGLAEDVLGPGGRRRADDPPGELAHRLAARPLLVVGDRLRLADPRPVEPVEEAGPRFRREQECGAVAVGDRLEPLDHPRRRVVERLLGCLLDQDAPDAVVDVTDVYEARPGVVGGGGERPHEVCVVEEAVDHHRLPRLHVDADAGDQPRVRLDQLWPRLHGGDPIRRRGRYRA